MPDKKKIDLTDPNCEPTLDDFRKIARSAGDKVREQTKQRAEKTPAEQPKPFNQ